MSIRLADVSLAQLSMGLQAGLFDAGLAMADEVGAEIVASPLWQDPYLVTMPARHPLLAYKSVPLKELMNYPLVLCDQQACAGCHQQGERLFRAVNVQPTVAEYVSTHSLMLVLVAAGYGVGFSSAAHLDGCARGDVVVRPLAEQEASLMTYLLRPAGEIMKPLQQFIDRADRVGRVQALI